jgi:hypothetical protein
VGGCECCGCSGAASSGREPDARRVRFAPRHAAPRHATPRHAAPRHATPRHTGNLNAWPTRVPKTTCMGSGALKSVEPPAGGGVKTCVPVHPARLSVHPPLNSLDIECECIFVVHVTGGCETPATRNHHNTTCVDCVDSINTPGRTNYSSLIKICFQKS